MAARKRDYALERERQRIRVQAQGFRNAKERTQFNKEFPNATAKQREDWQRKRILQFFGITERHFNALRRENWKHQFGSGVLKAPKGRISSDVIAINRYDADIDRATHDWSEQRVGYILSFNAAVVNKQTNYDSLFRRGVRRLNRQGKPMMNKSQYEYLVLYAQLMSVDEYEARYGSAR